MSPNDTRQMGDLHDLPSCAPEWLKALFSLGEGVLQKQIELLGEGKPSQAPDLHDVLGENDIEPQDNESTMTDRYNDKQELLASAQSEYVAEDEGITVTTAGIGEVVTNAYDAIDTAVQDLNEQIDASHRQEMQQLITKDDGTPDLDDQGNKRWNLLNSTVSGLLTGLRETLDKTFEEVSSVSDQAAAEAIKINIPNEPSYPPTSTPAAYPATSYPTGGGSGTSDAGVTPTSGSMGTAIVPSGDKPDAMKMMQYLIEEHGFTPAQAAGIVANARYESHFDVGATGDNGTAHGLFQWRFDRYAGLQEFASRPGEDIGSWETHIDYMVHELRNGSSYQRAEDIVDGNPNDARAVAEGFDRHYERSSGHTINDRREYAAGVLDEWNRSNSNIAV